MSIVLSHVTDRLVELRTRLAERRARLGAKKSVLLLLLPLCVYGASVFGPRAALVLACSLAVCVSASVLPRVLSGQSYQLGNPGTVITGLLLGLTLSVDTPLYMIVVGGLVAEIAGKAPWPRLGRPLLNPAALGRGAVAVLEIVDPPVRVDFVSGSSPLMVAGGGAPPPEYWQHLLLGFTQGAIGETSALLLVVLGAVMLSTVVLKREAPLSLLIAAPLLVAFMPSTPRILGHAPWVLNPIVYVAGGSTLLMAFFFTTDPVTTPRTRAGGIVFGVGTAAIGVLGRLYTTIPGCEMWGVLIMNAATPWLDRALGHLPHATISSADAAAASAAIATGSYYPPPSVELASAANMPRLSVTPQPPLAALELDRAANDFEVLRELLSRRPIDRQRIVDAAERSGLSGCGGALFPVHKKWAATLRYAGPRKLVINGQEGEPTTFKDRLLMEHAPGRVVEGAALAALAIEADEVILVVKSSYASCLRAIDHAIAELHALEPALPFTLRSVKGPPLYVCGEETALLSFLESRRGEPRERPPFPAERGLFDRPTTIHNVETVSWLPQIVASGGARFAEHGAPRLVSVSGAVRKRGVYRVALGTPLSRIVELAGGVPMDGTLKAVVVGGPAGGLLPPSLLGLPYQADALAREGATLGAGSIVVLSSECLLRTVVESADFMARESCGLCTPCRVGTAELSRLCGELFARSASPDTPERLNELSGALVLGSRCGLGRSAPAMLSSLQRHFPQVVQAYLHGEPCPCCDESYTRARPFDA